jgi:hypothetical protein
LEKAKAKDDAGDSKDEDKQKNKSKDPASPAVSTPPGTASPAPSSGPQHRQFELHRSIFAMRQRELKTREQGAKAKEVGKGELQSSLPSLNGLWYNNLANAQAYRRYLADNSR